MDAEYELSVLILGTGQGFPVTWRILIHRPGKEKYGLTFQARYVKETAPFITWQLDTRDGWDLYKPIPEGRVRIAYLTDLQRSLAKRTICEEVPIPGLGQQYKCQEWVVNAVAKLEEKTIIQSGKMELLRSLLEKTANEISGIAKDNWIAGPLVNKNPADWFGISDEIKSR